MMQMDEGGPRRVNEDTTPDVIGPERRGPFDYQGSLRELSYVMRTLLDLQLLVADPDPRMTEDKRQQAEARGIQGCKSHLRNALGVLDRRETALRLAYEETVSKLPCDVSYSITNSPDGEGRLVFSCATHRKMWGDVPSGDDPCAGWTVPEELQPTLTGRLRQMVNGLRQLVGGEREVRPS